MVNERRKQPFPLAPFPHLLRRLLSVCPPCSSAWRSWGSRRHGRFLTKDRAEILQRHELPPSRTLRSRNCPRSEDIFILADITRGTPALQSQFALTDIWLSCGGASYTVPRVTRCRNPKAILACPLKVATWADPGLGERPSHSTQAIPTPPDGSLQGPEAGTVSEGSSQSC